MTLCITKTSFYKSTNMKKEIYRQYAKTKTLAESKRKDLFEYSLLKLDNLVKAERAVYEQRTEKYLRSEQAQKELQSIEAMELNINDMKILLEKAT